MKKIFLSSFVFLAFFLFAPINGLACSCLEPYPYTAPLEEKVKTARDRAGAVFSGKVIAISGGDESKSLLVSVKFGFCLVSF